MLQNFKIRTKIIGLAIILLIVIIVTSIIGINQQIKLRDESLNSLETTMRSDYDEEIKN